MNQTDRSYDATFGGLERLRRDPLHEITGLLVGALLGGAIWLSLISLALRR